MSQEYAGTMNHARRLAINCPTGHQTDKSVNNLFDSKGKNSRKSAPSTGKLPPTPRPMQAKRIEVVIQLGPRATRVPKSPHKNSVILKAGFRPMISDATPQKVDPMLKPMNVIMVVYRI